MECPREFAFNIDLNRFKKRLFVSGLSDKTDQEKVIELFNIYGDCKVTIAKFNKSCAIVAYKKA